MLGRLEELLWSTRSPSCCVDIERTVPAFGIDNNIVSGPSSDSLLESIFIVRCLQIIQFHDACYFCKHYTLVGNPSLIDAELEGSAYGRQAVKAERRRRINIGNLWLTIDGAAANTILIVDLYYWLIWVRVYRIWMRGNIPGRNCIIRHLRKVYQVSIQRWVFDTCHTVNKNIRGLLDVKSPSSI